MGDEPVPTVALAVSELPTPGPAPAGRRGVQEGDRDAAAAGPAATAIHPHHFEVPLWLVIGVFLVVEVTRRP